MSVNCLLMLSMKEKILGSRRINFNSVGSSRFMPSVLRRVVMLVKCFVMMVLSPGVWLVLVLVICLDMSSIVSL